MTTRNTNKGAGAMKHTTRYAMVFICTDCPGGCDCKPRVSGFNDLAQAVDHVQGHRECCDGSFRVELQNADGSPVTRGQVRAAGIKC
jgi:hypothetical protein